MSGYWSAALLGALGVVGLLALVVIVAAHLRRLLRVLHRYRSRTAAQVAPIQVAVTELRARRGA